MSDLPVDVIRSKKRKRTAQASVVEGRLRVLIPAGLPSEQESAMVSDLVTRVTRKMSSAGVDLETRARKLAKRYGLRPPRSIEWSDRQHTRWGSCSPAEGSVRVSNRLASMPPWVLDWVLIHELAHLEVPDHGERFQALVSRYELRERAKGYLMARSEMVSRHTGNA
jgi:hypothetical protein